MQTLTIEGTHSEPLNSVAEYILLEHAELIDRIHKLEFIEGTASLFGSGVKEVLKITITFDFVAKDDLEAIEQIIAWAKSSNADLDIERGEVDDS